MSANKTLITGGNGLIGTNLISHLSKKGRTAAVIGRSKSKTTESYIWDPETGTMDENALLGSDTIIHLAGAGISDKRWTKSRKNEIIESRKNGANLLFEKLKKNKHQIKTFISASAVGYYGDNGDTWLEEGYHNKEDFLGETCRRWEESALQFEKLGIRVVIYRIGIVLAQNGGALPVMAKPVRFFAGAALGSGKQYISWIHIDDLCRLFTFAIENQKLSGIFNAVAPGPVTNKEFMKEIAGIVHRPFWPINVPSFMMKMILGEMAAIVLNSQRVSSEKIRLAGFEFQHSDLKKALNELL